VRISAKLKLHTAEAGGIPYLRLISCFSAGLLLLTFVSLTQASNILSTNRPLIRVHSETIARNDKLTLGDIAEISNTDESTSARLQNINLGYSPDVGLIRQIQRDKIVLAVAAAGFSEDSVEIKSQVQVTVRRESQLIDASLIREAVERATLAQFHARGVKARLMRLDLPPRVEVRTGSAELRASIGNLKNLFSPFGVSVDILIDGRSARRLNVLAQIEATTSVVVAASDLAARTRLRAQDFTIETVKLDRDFSTYVFDPIRLRGVTLTRALSKGQPVTTDAVAPDIVVKPGDVVRIIADSAKLSIALTGEARASGHVGDRIQVKNLQSGTLVQAIVVDEGIVSVRF